MQLRTLHFHPTRRTEAVKDVYHYKILAAVKGTDYQHNNSSVPSNSFSGNWDEWLLDEPQQPERTSLSVQTNEKKEDRKHWGEVFLFLAFKKTDEEASEPLQRQTPDWHTPAGFTPQKWLRRLQLHNTWSLLTHQWDQLATRTSDRE